MTEHADYDYQELAYDLFHEGSDLLEKLVELRKQRGMTQADLAEKMNVSQGYVSKIESGYTDIVSKLTEYALEVGARLHYDVKPAEERPNGDRAYSHFSTHETVSTMAEWQDGGISIGEAMKETKYSILHAKEQSAIVSVHEMKPSSDPSQSSDMTSFTVDAKKELTNASW